MSTERLTVELLPGSTEKALKVRAHGVVRFVPRSQIESMKAGPQEKGAPKLAEIVIPSWLFKNAFGD